jgi:hypothetical protein
MVMQLCPLDLLVERIKSMHVHELLQMRVSLMDSIQSSQFSCDVFQIKQDLSAPTQKSPSPLKKARDAAADKALLMSQAKDL